MEREGGARLRGWSRRRRRYATNRTSSEEEEGSTEDKGEAEFAARESFPRNRSPRWRAGLGGTSAAMRCFLSQRRSAQSLIDDRSNIAHRPEHCCPLDPKGVELAVGFSRFSARRIVGVRLSFSAQPV